MYKAIIWDLDGTLLDTLDDLTDAVNHTMTLYNHPTRTKEEVRSFLGNGVRLLIDLAFGQDVCDDVLDEAVIAQKEFYTANSMVKTAPYEGIVEILNFVKQKGLKNAICSNKHQGAVEILANHYLPGLIDVTVGENPIYKKKPSPDSLLGTMNQLGLNKEDILYVGDSDVDVLTAINAGVDCLAVSYGFRDKQMLIEAGAKNIADNTLELKQFIEKVLA